MIIRLARKALSISRKLRSKIKDMLSARKHYLFNVDTPKSLHVDSKKIVVEGWIISKHKKSFDVRIRNNATYQDVNLGVERFDVQKAHGEEYGEAALNSGFISEFEFEDGVIILEVNDGFGWKELQSKKIKYGVDKSPSYYYNKDLAWRMAEHQNLIENRRAIYSEEDQRGVYDRGVNDPRLMAIYLPQFHPITQNDIAWGKGFTEWNNVTTGVPRFVGHEQPILPSTLGFYDLRFEGKILEQIQLAKNHGIYGFAFYYYWFSGEKILDMPLNSFLKHKEWDFNFSICWANENWTKRWDGRDSDVIIAQKYKEDDPLAFIKDVEDILNDPRYLQYENKPILTVYRISHLDNPKRYAEIWREYFKKTYNKELYLVSCMSFDDLDPRDFGFDAAMDFAPLSAFFKQSKFSSGRYPYVSVEDKLLDVNFDGVLADYRTIATTKNLIDSYDYKTFGCVTPSWDNDSRKKGKGFVFTHSSPDIYAEWLGSTIETYAKKEQSPIIYINAWNEWAEGAVVEPTYHQGYAVLNRTTEVLAKFSSSDKNKTSFPAYGITRDKKKKMAVIVHLFHVDLWDEIYEKLKLIDEPFDIFVSITEKDKGLKLPSPHKTTKIHTFVLPNRGRDVLPFLFMLRRVEAAGYEYILKLHSKKSKWRTDGEVWFKELLTGLLPSKEIVKKIISRLQIETTSIIGPSEHIVSLQRHIGSNQPILHHLLTRTYNEKDATDILNNKAKYPFVGGTMLWARTDALKPLIDLFLLPDDFQSEHGQIDGTLAHAIERYLGVLAHAKGKRFYAINQEGLIDITEIEYTKKYHRAP